jgi:HSP90 family molecular chaperone
MSQNKLWKEMNVKTGEQFMDEAKFKEFYDDFNLYFKEGITKAQDQNEKEDIASMLRFESNRTEPGKYTTLNEYISRMKDDQKDILYFAAPT